MTETGGVTTVWGFFNNNPIAASVAFFSILIAICFIAFILARAIKHGKIDGEISASKDGFKLKTGKNKEFDGANYIAGMLSFSNHLTSWREEVRTKIAEMQANTISDCVQKAVRDIDNLASKASFEYSKILLSKKQSLTVEDNYQVIIYGFVINQVKESFKDTICEIIRKDKIEEKTKSEREAIADSCFMELKNLFKIRTELSKEVLLEIEKEYRNDIISIILDNLDLSETKYRICRQKKEELISASEIKFNEKIKNLFPGFNLPEVKYEFN